MIIGGGRQLGNNVQKDVQMLRNDPQQSQQVTQQYVDNMDPMAIAGLTSPVNSLKALSAQDNARFLNKVLQRRRGNSSPQAQKGLTSALKRMQDMMLNFRTK